MRHNVDFHRFFDEGVWRVQKQSTGHNAGVIDQNSDL